MHQAISKLLALITLRRRRGAEREADAPRPAVLQRPGATAGEDVTPLPEAVVDELVGFSHVDQAKEAEPSYLRVLSLAEQRYGAEHMVTLKAKKNLAAVYAFQGRFDEAASLAAEVLPRLRREVGEQDEELIGNLILWYRNAGRNAEADALEHARWKDLPLCDHLKPLEDYLLAAGGRMSARGRWGGTVVSFDAYLDIESLQQRLSLAPCVEVSEMDDPHYGFAKGFACSMHQNAIWGYHPREKVSAPTIS